VSISNQFTFSYFDPTDRAARSNLKVYKKKKAVPWLLTPGDVCVV
jgi:hypothetical protein